ncbi:unannotated protein [freshwater metagenome]|uniref:Unannotated protein n=1 Tax=freshwater metagenome TaxID=449393 RepID=A0A6J6INN5_9ZZZZ
MRACAASIIGWRGKVGTTAVPSSMPGTSRDAMARAVSVSRPKICGIHAEAKPASAIAFTSSIAASTVRGWANIPSFMSWLRW